MTTISKKHRLKSIFPLAAVATFASVSNAEITSDDFGKIFTDPSNPYVAQDPWANGDLFVGSGGGHGTLTIDGGSDVTSTFTKVGNVEGDTGAVTVTGAGSLWHAEEVLWVGKLPVTGLCTLDIADGGMVKADRTLGPLGPTDVACGGDGWIRMQSGGQLAIKGAASNILAAGGPSTTSGFLGSVEGPNHVQYWDGSAWTNMWTESYWDGSMTVPGVINATLGVDYTLEAGTVGEGLVGYAVLTVLAPGPSAGAPGAPAAITSIARAGTTATIDMTGVNGTTYTCDSSPNLVDWTLGVATNAPIVPVGGVFTFTVDATPAENFYRIAE